MAKRATTAAKLNEQGEALKKRGKSWLDRVESAWKREETWSKDAEAATKAYTNEPDAGSTGKLYDYNIFHANVETIVPAIINSPPVPDIRRRFGDADPVAKQFSDIIERAILVQVDDAAMQTELEGQAQDAFMAGRGVIRLRFHADTVETETSALQEAQDEASGDAQVREPSDEGEGGDYREDGGQQGSGGVQVAAPDGGAVANERITFEAVSWRDYQHGPATRWENRPWESYRHVMLADDVKDFADHTMVSLQAEPGGSLYGDMSGDVVLYEIWDKKSRKVIFIDDAGHLLKEIDDPLGLKNFFPSTPRPVQPIELVGRLMPVTPFSIYKKLADELDIISKRIRILTDAMKVKGAYVGAIGEDLSNFATADDNELVVISNVELTAMLQNGSLDSAITWWPVEKFQPVLAELFKNRDLTKQAIYEITGISDIVRGASKASETLGAQQIKTQWGSLRIQKMQRMMERSARDLFVMMSEIIPAKFSHETLERMTSIPITLQPNDDEQTVAQKLQLQALMKESVATFYRIDVESESTIRADLTMKKQEAGEFLSASAAYFAAVGPLVQEGALPREAAIEIYAANARLFNLGKSTEDVIEGMVKQAQEAAKNPQPKPPSPEEVKAQADAQKMQADIQAQQAQQQIDMQAAQTDAQRAQAEAQAKEVENAERMQALRAKEAKEQQDRAVKAQQAEQDAANKQRVADLEYQLKEVQLATARVSLATAAVQAGTPQGGGEEGEPAPTPSKEEISDIISAVMPDGKVASDRHVETSQALNSMAEAIKELAQAQMRPKSVTAPSGKTYTVN